MSNIAVKAKEELITGKKPLDSKPDKTYLKRNIAGVKGDIRTKKESKSKMPSGPRRPDGAKCKTGVNKSGVKYTYCFK